MSKYKVYTPDGVQDILFEECFIKRDIETKTRNLLRNKGYREIETPSIEFYDVYSSRQKMLSQETMFKFCDKEGRILALRPDLTVPAVRVATSKLKDNPKPMQLFYIGNSFRYNENGGGRQKEYTEAGIEIIGAADVKADAEVIATAVKLLLSIGLENFQIDIGQVEFFKGLIAESDFSEDEAEELRELIDNKDFFGIEKIIGEKNIPQELKDLILSMPSLFGSKDILDKIEKMNINEKSRLALANLREILDILEDYGCSDYISVDLGMLPGLDYYTGTIFRGFTYGIGFPILSGGRYDKLAETFGEAEPATGFSLGINMLITAMRRQGITEPQTEIEYFLGYAESERRFAFEKAEELRKEDKPCAVDVKGFSMEEALEYALKNNFSNMIYISESGKLNQFKLKDLRGGTDI